MVFYPPLYFYPRFILIIFISTALSKDVEYKINYERLELAFYNETLIDDGFFAFKKYNRTHFYMNASVTTNVDLDGHFIDGESSVHRKFSNGYIFMGAKLNYNVCKAWRNNLWGMRDQFTQYGNLELCDIKKKRYYINNFMPDESYFPKLLPLGEYRVDLRAFDKRLKKTLVKLEWYVEVQLKITWQT